jgi:hypothetical protein
MRTVLPLSISCEGQGVPDWVLFHEKLPSCPDTGSGWAGSQAARLPR